MEEIDTCAASFCGSGRDSATECLAVKLYCTVGSYCSNTDRVMMVRFLLTCEIEAARHDRPVDSVCTMENVYW